MNKLVNIANEFKNKKILVVGDVMLDKYIYGDVRRISPEAPVPVLNVKSEDYALGGSTNTAKNILELGGEVYLVGIIGEDHAGEILLSYLNNFEDLEGLVIDSNDRTTEKVRTISKGQQLIRTDYERKGNLSESNKKEIINVISDKITYMDAVLVSDYGKGLINEGIMRNLLSLCKKLDKPLVIDPKPVNRLLYRGANLITPNKDEAFAIANGLIQYKNLSEVGGGLVNYMEGNVLITRGKEGMSLFEIGKEQKDIITAVKEVYDVTGAGDTVASVMALGLASNSTLYDSALIANIAAGISVSKFGAYAVKSDELKDAILSL